MAKLNEKQKMWCDEYLANGYNATAAYKKIYGATPNSDKNAYALKVKPHVQEYIQTRLAEIVGPKEEIIEKMARKLSEVAFEDAKSEDIALQHQLKALELLGKQLGVYTTKVEANIRNYVIDIEDDADDDSTND